MKVCSAEMSIQQMRKIVKKVLEQSRGESLEEIYDRYREFYMFESEVLECAKELADAVNAYTADAADAAAAKEVNLRLPEEAVQAPELVARLRLLELKRKKQQIELIISSTTKTVEDGSAAELTDSRAEVFMSAIEFYAKLVENRMDFDEYESRISSAKSGFEECRKAVAQNAAERQHVPFPYKGVTLG